MYAFAQRSDTTVADEPFYAVYLSKSGARHPGRDEVLQAQSADESVVKKQFSKKDKDVLFIKNMAHHMEVMESPFIENAVNIFLIRDPKQIIASYAQVIEQPIMRDIGIAHQYELFSALQAKGEPAIVLDSGLLLQNPESVLKQLCHHCTIGFEHSMLKWSAGPKSYDGVWAKHWYANVHRSTGFEMQSSSSRPLPENLNDLYQQARKYYEKLIPFSLKA